MRNSIAVTSCVALALLCGCATRPANVPTDTGISRAGPTSAASTVAIATPTRTLRFDTASMQFPANLPEPKQEGTYLFSEGTADQIDPSLADAKSIIVGVNIYSSPATEFGKRADVRDWADHPMPPNSAFRRATASAPRSELLSVSGAAEAAIAISLHDGAEPFGTGGQRTLSIRLFVKDPKGDGSGWVVGAYAYGNSDNPQIAMDSTLSRELESVIRSFRVDPAAPSTR